jgi:hypothetical protein
VVIAAVQAPARMHGIKLFQSPETGLLSWVRPLTAEPDFR